MNSCSDFILAGRVRIICETPSSWLRETRAGRMWIPRLPRTQAVFQCAMRRDSLILHSILRKHLEQSQPENRIKSRGGPE
jgi:hypothetical protein